MICSAANRADATARKYRSEVTHVFELESKPTLNLLLDLIEQDLSLTHKLQVVAPCTAGLWGR